MRKERSKRSARAQRAHSPHLRLSGVAVQALRLAGAVPRRGCHRAASHCGTAGAEKRAQFGWRMAGARRCNVAFLQRRPCSTAAPCLTRRRLCIAPQEGRLQPLLLHLHLIQRAQQRGRRARPPARRAALAAAAAVGGAAAGLAVVAAGAAGGQLGGRRLAGRAQRGLRGQAALGLGRRLGQLRLLLGSSINLHRRRLPSRLSS